MTSKIRLICLKMQVVAPAMIGSLAALLPSIADAAVAGQVQFVSGDVRIVDTAGNARVAQKGQDINEGETVVTAATSTAQLRMIDGGILALRPDTQLKVDTYVFKGSEDGSENALLSLVKGGLRTITGLIGHQNKDKLKLRTPTATIGIRGTDHEPIVLVEPTAGSAAPGNPPGTYDKVNLGATSLTTNVGTAVINPNQVGFASSLNQAPVLLPKLPDFYRATPSPVAHAGQRQGSTTTSTASAVQSTAEPSEASTASSSSESKTDTTTSVAAAPASELTGVNSSGETINLANQTLTTSSGQTVSLNNASSANSGGSSSGSSSSGSGSTAAPAAGTLLMIGFPYPVSNVGAIPEYFSLGGPGLMLANDTAGNLTGATLSGDANASDSGGDFNLSGTGAHYALAQSGSMFINFGSNAATGIAWGRWQGGTVTETSQYFGQDASGNYGIGADNSSGQFVIGGTQTQTIDLGQGSLHWMTAPNPYPGYLAQVLTGTANYTLIGGTNPTDQNGDVGTLNSATLGVNFSTQTAKANLNFTVAGNTWGMQTGSMNLDSASFSTYTSCAANSSTCGNVVLTKNGVVTSNAFNSTSPTSGYSNGAISGFLTGNGLNGAVLEYTVQDVVIASGSTSGSGYVNNAIQGVAAFSGPTQNVATPFRVVGISDGWNNIGDLVSSSNSNNVFNYGPSYRGSITGNEQPVSTIVDGSAGLTSFLGQANGYTAANSSVSVPSPGSGGQTSTINVGTAVNTNIGSTTVDGITVTWGRWAGGTVNIYSLDGSTLLGTIDNANRSIHWITTSSLTNTTFNMPMTGTATYMLAGNTDPTDYKGNTGTLNSATLNADFGNAKVNTSLNISFNAANNTSTWTLNANNVPLGSSNGGGFSSDSAQNGVNGITNTVTCTGASCGSANHDYVQGHFVAGAQGAVIFYGMSTGNNANSTNSSGVSTTTFTPINGVTGLVVMRH
jgi:hypothetical protein